MAANPTLFRKVLQLVQDGNNFEARRLVADEINRCPQNADAWIVMAQLVEDRERAIYYLERSLELRPDDDRARRQLDRLKGAANPRNTARRATIGTPIPAHVIDTAAEQPDVPPDEGPELNTVDLIRTA